VPSGHTSVSLICTHTKSMSYVIPIVTEITGTVSLPYQNAPGFGSSGQRKTIWQTRHTTSYDITSSDRPIPRRCAQLFRFFIIKFVLKIHIFHSTGVHQWTACLMPAIYSCKYITSKRPTRTGAHPVDGTRLPLTPRRFQALVLQRCEHLAAACSC
jgi:hypothetical protein